METINVVVDAMSRQGKNNIAVTLVRDNGSALPAFEAGAHIDVHLPGGLIRQYSLAGHPARRTHYQLCIKREQLSRGGSAYVHDQLRVGQPLTISLPRNLFALLPATHYVLMAGGIGITPLLSMAEQLDEQGIAFELHYFARQMGDVAFKERLARGFEYGHCHVWCSEAGYSPRHFLPDAVKQPVAGARLYLCGPAAFTTRVTDSATLHGWDSDRIHAEAFAPVAPAAATVDDGTAFTVELAKTGRRVEVGPQQTIAQALQAHDIAVPLSCEMGICGACLTPVLAGEVDHRDTVQSEQEKAASIQQIALCCSRSKSSCLVLDL